VGGSRSRQGAVVASMMLGVLLFGCGSADSTPLAEREVEPEIQSTERDQAAGQQACSDDVVCAEGYVIDRQRVDDGEGPASIVDPGPCRDDGECAEGFSVEETFHTLSCGAVRPELVTDEVVASGRWAGDDREVRVIAGVDPDVLVAIDIAGGECADGDVALSEYSMVFVGTPDAAGVREAVCTAAVDEHLDRNGC